MDPVQDARWLAAKNNDAGEMPAFAVAVVASSGTEGQFVLTKPTANGEHAWIAGAVPALAGDGAEVTNDFPAWALYDDGDGTPAVGETWGAGASSWKLRKNNAGFRICGTPDTTLKIVPVERAASSGRGFFAANLTEATGAASWQSRTLSGGSWTDGATTGADNAYPVQCGGSAFTPAATSTTLMWEEPAGSGVYAFLPIQYASTAVPGFVSTAAQSIAGVKTFTDKILCSAIANSAFTVGIQTPGILLSSPGGTPGTTKGVITWNSSYGGSNGVVDIQSGPVGINVPTAYYVGGTVGGTATVDGMVFQGGLYISGSPPPPPPPPPPGVTSIGISSTGGSISVTGSPVTGSGTINVETSGASGTDPDAGVFSNGRCTTISTLGGVDTTWTVAVGDTVVISKGRIQSITPGS